MAFEKNIEEFPWMLAFCNKEYSLKKAVRIQGWLGKLYGILFFIGGCYLMALPGQKEMEAETRVLSYIAAIVNLLFGILCFIFGIILRFKVQYEEEVTIFRTLGVVSIGFSILDFPISLMLWAGIYKSNKRLIKNFIIYRCVLLAVFFIAFILCVTYAIPVGGLDISKYFQGVAIILWFHFTIANNVLYLNMMYLETIKSVVNHLEILVEKSERNPKTSKGNEMGWVKPNKK